jgi:hypothetical protein
MKTMKLLFLLSITFLLSCTKENVLLDSQNLAMDLSIYDESGMGTYKGVFTTTDSKSRATVFISLKSNDVAIANITLVGGEVVVLKSVNYVSGTFVNNVQFTSDTGTDIANQVSFEFSVDSNGTNSRVDNVLFNNTEGYILIAKETSLSRVTAVTGTYTCELCTLPTTFSVITQVVNGELLLNTQVLFNGVDYGGGGSVTNCVYETGITTCTIQSVTEIPSGNIESVGIAEYNTPADCTYMSGTWIKTNTGTNGTFETDDAC